MAWACASDKRCAETEGYASDPVDNYPFPEEHRDEVAVPLDRSAIVPLFLTVA